MYQLNGYYYNQKNAIKRNKFSHWLCGGSITYIKYNWHCEKIINGGPQNETDRQLTPPHGIG